MNKEIDFITIQISAKIYSGFQYKIPKDIINKMSEEEIIVETKTYMKNFFNNNNLYILKDGIDTLQLHFHDTIPIKDDITIIYLCDHCH